MKPVLEYPKTLKREERAQEIRRQIDYTVCALVNSSGPEACYLLKRILNLAVHLYNRHAERASRAQQSTEGAAP